MTSLASLGWDPAYGAAPLSAPPPGGVTLEPARVATHDRARFRVLTPAGELGAELSGRLRHAAGVRLDLPVVGDWVAVTARLAEGSATIHGVYPRRSVLVRKQAGRETRPQPLAANVDAVLLVVGADRDLNPRRIERYLGAIWESGALPVVLLNKVDACDAVSAALAEVVAAAPGAEVHPVSGMSGQGLEALAPHLVPGRTLALVGSSGVGKSTLLNRLLEEEQQATGAVREADGRGRHTTTRRELRVLPTGALVIDTPGLRELQPWSEGEGVSGAFPEITQQAAACRFRDCTHQHEPGCGVQAALVAGEVSEERYDAFLKLAREQAHLVRKADRRARADERRRNRVLARAIRQRLREKGRRD